MERRCRTGITEMYTVCTIPQRKETSPDTTEPFAAGKLSRLSGLTSLGNTRSQLEATNISSQSLTYFRSWLKRIRSECTQHR